MQQTLQFDSHEGRGSLHDAAGEPILEFEVSTAAGAGAAPTPLLTELAAREQGCCCQFTIRLLPAEPAHVQRVALTCRAGSAAAGLLSPLCRVLAPGESRTAGRRTTLLAELVAEADGALTMPAPVGLFASDGRALLLGLGGVAQDFPSLELTEGQVSLVFSPQRTITQPLEYSIILSLGDDPLALLESYGDLLAAAGARVGPVPTGWNSWDYYQGAVTMEAVEQEMQAISNSPLAGRLRWICLDMGWETRWGDWQTNRHFPETLADTAARIRAAGFEPGIWLSPLQLSTYVPQARCSRGMYCHNADGEAIIGPGGYLLLDPTHPESRDWLFSLCRGMREAGFTLFKIDYLYRDYLELVSPLHDLNVGRAGFARRFFEIIREAIGDDAHLISCGAPWPAAFGLADSARISTDIHNFWGHVVNSAVQIANAYWLNGRVWVNDPDFALIRCAQTSTDCYLNPPYQPRPYAGSEDFWMAGENATLEELRTWLALVHLCGGSLFASDSIARLNEQGQALLARLFEQPGPPARPLDLLESVPPRVWLSEQSLGLINYADCSAEILLPEGLPPHGKDFWTGAPVTLGASAVLPPHGSLLVTLT